MQEYFLRKGVAFQDLDVLMNPQAMKEMVELSGQKDLPVVLVNRQVFVGFNPDELDLVVPSLF
jgi:glutaredoxin